MRKKLVIFGILAAFVLISVSASGIYGLSQEQIKRDAGKANSPLFGIRLRESIVDRNNNVKSKIVTIISNFLSTERIFLMIPTLEKGHFGLNRLSTWSKYMCDTYSGGSTICVTNCQCFMNDDAPLNHLSTWDKFMCDTIDQGGSTICVTNCGCK